MSEANSMCAYVVKNHERSEPYVYLCASMCLCGKKSCMHYTPSSPLTAKKSFPTFASLIQTRLYIP